MPCATVTDMLLRFGASELVRASNAGDATDVNEPPVILALEDAAAVIEGYLRPRYALPLAPPVPREVVRACCILARFDLHQGGDKVPSEEMRRERDGVLAWLRGIADGGVELRAAPARGGSDARVQDRERLFGAQPRGVAWNTRGSPL